LALLNTQLEEFLPQARRGAVGKALSMKALNLFAASDNHSSATTAQRLPIKSSAFPVDINAEASLTAERPKCASPRVISAIQPHHLPHKDAKAQKASPSVQKAVLRPSQRSKFSGTTKKVRVRLLAVASLLRLGTFEPPPANATRPMVYSSVPLRRIWIAGLRRMPFLSAHNLPMIALDLALDPARATLPIEALETPSFR
jgi:hypothetical protein